MEDAEGRELCPPHVTSAFLTGGAGQYACLVVGVPRRAGGGDGGVPGKDTGHGGGEGGRGDGRRFLQHPRVDGVAAQRILWRRATTHLCQQGFAFSSTSQKVFWRGEGGPAYRSL